MLIKVYYHYSAIWEPNLWFETPCPKGNPLFWKPASLPRSSLSHCSALTVIKDKKKKKKPGRAFWCLSVRESGSREMVERCSFLTVYVVVGVMDVIEGTGKREENKWEKVRGRMPNEMLVTEDPPPESTIFIHTSCQWRLLKNNLNPKLCL